VKVAGDGDGIEQVMKGAPFFSLFGSYVLIFSRDVRVEGPERRALRYTIGREGGLIYNSESQLGNFILPGSANRGRDIR